MIKKLYILPLSLLFNIIVVHAQSRVENSISAVMKDYQVNVNMYDEDGIYSTYKADKYVSLFYSSTSSVIVNFLESEYNPLPKLHPMHVCELLRNHFSLGYNIDTKYSVTDVTNPVKVSPTQEMASLPVEIKFVGLSEYDTIAEFISYSNTVWFVFSSQNGFGNPDHVKIYAIQEEKPELKEYVKVKAKKRGSLNKTSGTKVEVLPLNTSPTFTQSIGLYSHLDNIRNNEIGNDKNYCFKPGFGISGEYNIYKKLGKSNWGIISGIGFAHLSANIYCNTHIDYDDHFSHTDIDDEQYDLYLDMDITEKYSLNYIYVPIKLNYTFQKSKIHFGAGVNIQYLLSSKTKIDGTYETKGYYEKYHIELFDLPAYDFGTENLSNKELAWEPPKLNFLLDFEFGKGFELNNKDIIEIYGRCGLGLTDLGYSESKYKYDYYYLYQKGGKTQLQSFGVGIRYKFIK